MATVFNYPDVSNVLARALASRISSLNYDHFDADARRWAKDAIADMIGCALLGADAGITEAITSVDGLTNGPCLILGTKIRTGRLDAALINGTAGHALDYDDTSKSMSGHPTVIIVPAILAVAEAAESSGRDFLDAYIVGVETATRIARGVNFHHYEKGWHPTATLGIFGAAAASARLLRLPEDQIAHALAICVSLAAGVKANFGTPIKPLHAGMAARNGLFAALLAQKGIDASPVAFEHVQGFLEVFNGAGNYDAARMLEGWGAPLDLLNPGISIKKYPCVYSVHGAIDAAIDLRSHSLSDSAQIASVRVTMHRRRLLPHVLNKATSALNAKFSLSYAVARALVDGAVSLHHFENDALQDAEVQRVMELIETQAHDDDSNDYGAEVVVTLASGERQAASVTAPLGRGPEAPLRPGMLQAKFVDCASRSLTKEGCQKVFGQLMDLENLPLMSALTGAIEAASHRR